MPAIAELGADVREMTVFQCHVSLSTLTVV